MKQQNLWGVVLMVLAGAGSADAAAVQYSLSATHASELSWNGAQFVPTVDPYLFANGTAVTITFSYDAATPATSSNNVSTGGLSGYGPNSYYTGAVTGLSGAVLGYSFSASSADTVVANSNTGVPVVSDGVFHLAGAGANAGSPALGGLTGFTVNDFNLIGLTAYSVGTYSYLSDQQLPAVLGAPGAANTGLNLVFRDSGGNIRSANFWNGDITPVPLPGALMMFAAGLLGLGASRKLSTQSKDV